MSGVIAPDETTRRGKPGHAGFNAGKALIAAFRAAGPDGLTVATAAARAGITDWTARAEIRALTRRRVLVAEARGLPAATLYRLARPNEGGRP